MGVEISQVGVSTALIVGQNSKLTSEIYNLKCLNCPARFFTPGKSHCSKISTATGRATVTLIHTSTKDFAEKVAACTPRVVPSKSSNLTLQSTKSTLV